MNRSRLLLVVAAVLSGTAVVFLSLGAVYNLLLTVLALPFAVAAYILWTDATGRVPIRWVHPGRRRRSRSAARGPRSARSRVAREARAGATGGRAGAYRTESAERTAWSVDDGGTTRRERRRALRTLGLEGNVDDFDEATIRAAYRDRVKEVHPDAEEGDEEAFKRVTDAYERLRDAETAS